MEHSPTPWRVGKNDNRIWIDGARPDSGIGPDTVCTIPVWGVAIPHGDKRESVRNANAERIVACVNACDGIEDSILTPGNMVKMRDLLAEVTNEATALGMENERLDRDNAILRAMIRDREAKDADEDAARTERLAAVVAETNAAHKDAFIEGVTQL